MRWPWRVPPPELPMPQQGEDNGSIQELKDYARQARRRSLQDRRRVERAAPRIAELPEEEFVARLAELFRPRYL